MRYNGANGIQNNKKVLKKKYRYKVLMSDNDNLIKECILVLFIVIGYLLFIQPDYFPKNRMPFFLKKFLQLWIEKNQNEQNINNIKNKFSIIQKFKRSN
jgi:hypothetical protein